MFQSVKVQKGSTLANWLKVALPDYRKHSVYVCDTNAVTLDGGYWDEGSRSSWMHYTVTGGRLASLSYPTAPPHFGGGNPPRFAIPEGTIVVHGGVSAGKPRTVSLYGNTADINALLAPQV
jgi:hypothetical protein